MEKAISHQFFLISGENTSIHRVTIEPSEQKDHFGVDKPEAKSLIILLLLEWLMETQHIIYKYYLSRFHTMELERMQFNMTKILYIKS